jgi:electron transport complex protein RnfC
VLRAKSLAKSRARNKRKDPEAADEEPEPAAKQAKKRKAKKAKSAKAKAAASFRLKATAAKPQLAAAKEPRSPPRAAAAKPKAKAKCTAAMGSRALAKEPAAADEEPAAAAAAKSKRLPNAWNREMSDIMQSSYRDDLKGQHRFQACVKRAKERRDAKNEAEIAEAGAGAGVALPAGRQFGCARCRRDPSGCLGCCPAKAFAAATRRQAHG